MTSASDSALLLVNLGTPAAPTAAAVRRYLGEFLGDPRVVQIPRLLWKPLLHGLILPLRGARSAEKYAQVWLDEGSPLEVYTRRLAQVLQSRLPDWQVGHAMRYGEPALLPALRDLQRQGRRRIVVLPLYPQYSTTTTASVDDVVQAFRREAPQLDVRMIDDYAEHAGWIEAVAASIRDWRQRHDAGEHLLFSFHGLPQRVADAGDPYPRQCEAGARAIAQALGLRDGEWSLAYQSRFGRERWLEPATDTALADLAARGLRKVDVVCPGFAVDCLETLEEVAIGYAKGFANATGGELRYIPCLNDSPTHADALAELVTASSASTD
ncbi:ferrochelatase [Pseudoxanthomonas kalamensis DSM 18571]|uniref:ferrochelatase n=1 Tax=Pseudoxanthomonas kalamensis TaxID=289483 RepID=UPI001390E660|nr:ferrochelatase [Pseudoxanthomonas kalamensis]KAF1712410.1 ferrochelatase [Pseudoxanthomonas kalamensis DSM 18571]